MDDNRFIITGTLEEKTETITRSQYLKTRDVRISITDVNPVTGYLTERLISMRAMNATADRFDSIGVRSVIEVSFYLDGKRYERKTDGRVMYFTNIVVLDVTVILPHQGSKAEVVEPQEEKMPAEDTSRPLVVDIPRQESRQMTGRDANTLFKGIVDDIDDEPLDNDEINIISNIAVTGNRDGYNQDEFDDLPF